MSDTRALLRRALASGYARLRSRLARQLGSDSLAGDVLHETWLRLGQGGELAPVANPDAYVYRVASNIAWSLRTGSSLDAEATPLDSIPDLMDEAPTQDRVIAGREELRILAQAVAALGERQRAVFNECLLQGAAPEALAERYGVSVRTIQTDLRGAILHCGKRLGRKDLFAERSFRVSRK